MNPVYRCIFSGEGEIHFSGSIFNSTSLSRDTHIHIYTHPPPLPPLPEIKDIR